MPSDKHTGLTGLVLFCFVVVFVIYSFVSHLPFQALRSAQWRHAVSSVALGAHEPHVTEGTSDLENQLHFGMLTAFHAEETQGGDRTLRTSI